MTVQHKKSKLACNNALSGYTKYQNTNTVIQFNLKQDNLLAQKLFLKQ